MKKIFTKVKSTDDVRKKIYEEADRNVEREVKSGRFIIFCAVAVVFGVSAVLSLNSTPFSVSRTLSFYILAAIFALLSLKTKLIPLRISFLPKPFLVGCKTEEMINKEFEKLVKERIENYSTRINSKNESIDKIKVMIKEYTKRNEGYIKQYEQEIKQEGDEFVLLQKIGSEFQENKLKLEFPS